MRVFLFILAVLAGISSFGVFAVSKTSIHEVYAAILLLIGAVLLGAAAIVEAISRNTKHAEAADKRNAQASAELAALIGRTLTPKAAPMAPTIPEPTGPRFYINTAGESSGPFPIEQLRALKTRGVVDDDTPVAKEGESAWRRIRDVLPAT